MTKRLRFSSHINKIVTIASLRAKLIIRCFQSRDPSLLITAFCVFVRPILEPSDPSLCVNGHVPGVGGRSRRHTTRLRQRNLDRPFCLPVTASAVGLERRRAADFRLTTLRPCVRRADQPTLAAHSAAHPV